MTTRLIALWRGINVGPNKRIAMADLRALLSSLGYTDVQTILQSGNAVFTNPGKAAPTAVAARIEQAVAKQLGVESKIVVRTAADIAAVITANPLRKIATDPSRHLVGFLSDTPSAVGLKAFAALDIPAPDEVRLIARELYLWCPKGVLDSPFSKVDWRRQLGVDVTMRNWNTVSKIAALATGSPTATPA